MDNKTNDRGEVIPCVSLFPAIQKELAESFPIAEEQLAAEKLGGNVVKESYWKGELAVLHRMRHVVEDNTEWKDQRASKSNLYEKLQFYDLDTAIIRYRRGGEIRDWAIACFPTDNEESFREHLSKWIPDAEFLEFAMK